MTLLDRANIANIVEGCDAIWHDAKSASRSVNDVCLRIDQFLRASRRHCRGPRGQRSTGRAGWTYRSITMCLAEVGLSQVHRSGWWRRADAQQIGDRRPPPERGREREGDGRAERRIRRAAGGTRIDLYLANPGSASTEVEVGRTPVGVSQPSPGGSLAAAGTPLAPWQSARRARYELWPTWADWIAVGQKD